jgi:hypothetical protein
LRRIVTCSLVSMFSQYWIHQAEKDLHFQKTECNNGSDNSFSCSIHNQKSVCSFGNTGVAVDWLAIVNIGYTSHWYVENGEQMGVGSHSSEPEENEESVYAEENHGDRFALQAGDF